jgi:acylphosphatase
MPKLVKKRVHVFYSGRVQGVGFRMTAEEAAVNFGVVGWVKNLRGGKVELVAEGDQSTLEKFLLALRNGPMKNFIQQVDVSWGNASDTFNGFEIRYF